MVFLVLHLRKIEKDPIMAKFPTDLALASNGIFYVPVERTPPPQRHLFVGYALRPQEMRAYGTAPTSQSAEL